MSLGPTADKLRAAGARMVGIVGTPADRARRYFMYRQPRYPVAADEDLVSHRAFCVPGLRRTEATINVTRAKFDDLARRAGIKVPPGGGWEALDREDGIGPDEFARATARDEFQLTAQFLIDRRGIIQWSNIETEGTGLEGLDQFPSDDELLAAVRRLQ